MMVHKGPQLTCYSHPLLTTRTHLVTHQQPFNIPFEREKSKEKFTHFITQSKKSRAPAYFPIQLHDQISPHFIHSNSLLRRPSEQASLLDDAHNPVAPRIPLLVWTLPEQRINCCIQFRSVYSAQALSTTHWIGIAKEISADCWAHKKSYSD